MATSKYTIAPPSVAPLLHEYGDWENIPDEAWEEYCAAQAYWARSRRMYADQGRHLRRSPEAKAATNQAERRRQGVEP
jgi:HJR/Mrr/RecB family endonuclease